MYRFTVNSSLDFLLCIGTNCPKLNDPDNGDVSVSTTAINGVATYSCDHGFTLSGNRRRVCQAGARWSGSEPSCEGKSNRIKSRM